MQYGGGGYLTCKLWCYLALATILFAFSCKQPKGGETPLPAPSNEITITVKGDADLEVKKPDTLKVKKDSTWKDIKATAISKITLKENQEIKEWRLGDAKGKVIEDTDKFEKDTVVFAIHKENINLTIEADEGYTFKDTSKPCKIKVEKGSTWAVVKDKAEMKVELKADYTATGWKLLNKDGQSLEDAYIFNNDSIIYATSKKNEVTITVAGDEGVNILEKKTFGAEKGASWGSIKEEAQKIAIAKEDFEIKEWHKTKADGELLKDESKFEESATVFAVTKRKIVKYTVEHWQENADDNEYSKVDKDTEEKEGEAGKNSDAKAKSYEGFEAQSFSQSIIKADGTTVIKIKYKRKMTSLILNLDGGETETKLEDGKDGNKLLKGKIGAKVEVKGLKKESYGFEKWEPALPATFPKEDDTEHTYTAKWTQDLITVTVQGDAGVAIGNSNTTNVAKGGKWSEIKGQVIPLATAKEYFEIVSWRLDSENGSIIKEDTKFTANTKVYVTSKRQKITITVQGDAGITVKVSGTTTVDKGSRWSEIKDQVIALAEAKEYFEIKEWRLDSDSGNIIEENTKFTTNKTVYVTSKRQQITITVQGDAGITVKDDGTATVDKGSRWSEIKDKVMALAEAKEYFEIKEWRLDSQNGSIIKEDTKFTANTKVYVVSKRKVVRYTVKHVKQNADNDDYTDWISEEKQGEAGTNTEALAKEEEGFEKPIPEQKEIKADGTTVVTLQYKRKVTSLIIDLQGGATTTKLDNEGGKTVLKGKYGASVNIKTPTKENYIFEKWEPALPATFPIKDDTEHTYTAKWACCITIKGDERVEVLEPAYIYVSAGKTFGEIKQNVRQKVKLKMEWTGRGYYGEYYVFYDWKKNDYDGDEIKDDDLIEGNITVFARTNYNQFKWVGDAIVGHYEHDPRGQIIIPKNTIDINYRVFESASGLTALDLKGCSKITSLGLRETGVKSVNLSSCSKLRRFLFFNCPRLENLNLSGCTALKEIECYGHENCSPLKTVNLTDCSELTKIRLNNSEIESIDLSICPKVGEIDFSNCKKLESVNLTGCAELQWIRTGDERYPSGFYGCEALKEVNLTGCSGLFLLELSGTAIKNIDLSPCPKVRKIDFSNCKNLESVNLTGCSELTGVDLENTAITSIDLSHCPNVKEIDFFNCKNLESVNLTGCSEIEKVKLNGTAITSIDLSHCPKVKEIDFSNCKNLKSVNLTGCSELTRVYLKNTAITSIDLSHCPKVESINFEDCKNLESVNLTGCTELKQITVGDDEYHSGKFSGCVALKEVNLTGCSKLTEVDLKNTAIKSIDLSHCSKVESINFEGCKKLESVNLTGCSALTKIRRYNLEGCVALKEVNLTGCSELTGVYLENTAIKSIDLSTCPKVESIDFKDCKKLESVNLTGCTRLTKIETGNQYYPKGFSGCVALKEVNLTGCSELIQVYLENTAITSIDLSTCSKVESISFKGCEKLESVNLTGCSELTGVDLENTAITSIDLSPCPKVKSINFKDCKKLESVNLTGCTRLTQIETGNLYYPGKFYGCVALKEVNLTGCSEIERVRLSGTAITSIDLSPCPKVTSISFYGCKNLESVNLTGCSSLTKITDYTFDMCVKAVVKLPSSITEIERGAFGSGNDYYCKEVHVPNERIKKLVKDSRYPEDRIKMY